MTSVPRDPDFWRRFSLAVHLNEDAEKIARGISPADPRMSPLQRPQLKHTYVFPSLVKLFNISFFIKSLVFAVFARSFSFVPSNLPKRKVPIKQKPQGPPYAKLGINGQQNAITAFVSGYDAENLFSRLFLWHTIICS